MSKICVKSRVTNNLVFIPVHLIESVTKNAVGHTLIRRTGKETIRVYESVDDVQRLINNAYGNKEVVVKEVVRQVDRPVYVPVKQPGYRPASRGDSIVDTALGIGAGIVMADIIGEIFDF